MVEAQLGETFYHYGGIIPFLCNVFLILFTSLFSLNLIFNKNFTKGIGFETNEAVFMGRSLGFFMFGFAAMLIISLFEINGFNSFNEIYGVFFIFALLSFLSNLISYFNILKHSNLNKKDIKNIIRPLIILSVVIIKFISE